MLPESVTILLLSSYSPELNPIKSLWHYLRSHYLSNRAYDAFFDAWQTLTPEILKSACACPCMQRAM